jgi:type II secretory pathway component PulC
MRVFTLARGISHRNSRLGLGLWWCELREADLAAKIQRGDVIEEVDNKAVDDVTEFARALSEMHGESALLEVERRGSTHYVVLQER